MDLIKKEVDKLETEKRRYSETIRNSNKAIINELKNGIGIDIKTTLISKSNNNGFIYKIKKFFKKIFATI